MKVNKASFLQRFFAWLIDQIILMILYLLAVFAVGLAAELYDQSNLDTPNLLLSLGVSVFLLALLLGHFLYFGYFWNRRGRSIGMGMMNIKVVKTDNHSLSFLMAGLRGSIGYYLSSLIFGVGYLWFFVDEQQQTWHDKIFNTIVLEG